MKTESLAYKISEHRAKHNIAGDSDGDWRCAEYILRVEKDLPLDNDWRGWERVIGYHKI